MSHTQQGKRSSLADDSSVSSSTKERKFANTTTATLIVGSDKTRFIVHEEILCKASQYFRGALQSSFREAADKTITWDQESPEVVELLVQWVYGRYSFGSSSKDLFAKESLDSLLEIYFFADRYQIHEFKNHITELIVQVTAVCDKVPFSIAQVHHLYKNTPVGSALRKLAVARWTTTSARKWFAEESSKRYLLQDIPEFAIDLLAAYTDLLDFYGVNKRPRIPIVAENYFDSE